MTTLLIVMTGVAAVVLIITAVLLWYLPYLTRSNLFFSVTVETNFRRTPPAKAIVARYRRSIVWHTAMAFMLLILAVVWGRGFAACIIVVILPLLWQAGGMVLAVARARMAVRPHAVLPRRIRTAALQPPSPYRGHRWLMPILLLIPLVLMVIGAIYLGLRWEDIPQRYPTHWNAAGEVDGWAVKSIGGVFSPLLSALVSYLPPGVIIGFLALTRRTATSGTAAIKESRFRQMVKLSSLVLANLLAVFIVFAAVWLPFRNNEALPVGLVAGIVAAELIWVIGFLVLCVRMGQGGHRLVPALPEGEAPIDDAPISDGTPDEAWKAGLFYYNPRDPAIMVEKRFGIGWDFNWANKWTWVILGAILLPSIFMTSVAIWFARHNHAAADDPASTTVRQAQHALGEAGLTFENDPELVGTWRAVDFVADPCIFDPAHPTPAEQLYLKILKVEPDGVVADAAWVWTKGAFFNLTEHTPACYELRQLNGRSYLFLEWISGDVTLRSMKPNYYVFQKEFNPG